MLCWGRRSNSWLAQECNNGNRKALLEDVLKWEGGETGRLCNKLWIEEHQETLIHGQLTQAEQQGGG